MRKAIVAISLCLLAPASVVCAQHTAAPTRQSFDQLMQAAGQARDENRDNDAIQLYRRALSEQPESEQALWYLSTTLFEKEQYAEARDALRQFMTIRSDASPGWALLGVCEFNLKEYPRALEHLQRARSAGIGDRKDLAQLVLFDLAALLTRFERYDESLQVLASADPDPSQIEVAGLAGLRLPFLPNEIPQDHRELVHLAGRAVLAVQSENDQEADSVFAQLVAAYPNEPGVHFLYGAHLARQHPDQAIPEFERELQISPFHVLARVRIAEQLIATQQFDRALQLARQAIELDPERASAHAFAGEALIGKGDKTAGIKELETARATEPSVSRIHWDLMRAYAAVGRRDDAEREKQEMQKLLQNRTPSSSQGLGDASTDSLPPQ